MTAAVAPETTPTPPAAPQATAPEVTLETPEQPTGPLTKEQAKRALRQDMAARQQQRTEPPKVEAEKPPEQTPAAEAKPAETPAAPAEAQPGQVTEKPAEAVAPQEFVIDIPADHPAARGQAVTLKLTDPEQAKVLKGLLNGTYVRVRENEELRGSLRELRQELAKREARDAASEKWQASPEFKAARAEVTRLQELEEQGELPKGAAERYWRGYLADFDKLATEEYTTRAQAIEQDESDRSAEQWINTARDGLPEYLPPAIRQLPQFGAWFDTAVETFNDKLKRGHYPHIDREPEAAVRREAMHKAFRGFFSALITAEPDARATFARTRQQEQEEAARKKAAAEQAAREREAIERAAIEKYKQDLAQKRAASPPNPLANLAGASRDRVSPGTGGSGQEQDLSAMTPHDLKRTLKAQTREEYARRRSQRP